MDSHDRSTTKFAKSITNGMNKRGLNVYYDYDKKSKFSGTIAISIEKILRSKNQIGQLDIAIVKSDKEINRAIVLIEIEETTDTPKTLIGDIFTTLMGDSIHLPGRKKYSNSRNLDNPDYHWQGQEPRKEK